jgi:hypothetical protein
VNEAESQKVKGTKIDNLLNKKEINLQTLIKELKELARERDQLKTLNIRLMERTEKLQNIIEDEASAN